MREAASLTLTPSDLQDDERSRASAMSDGCGSSKLNFVDSFYLLLGKTCFNIEVFSHFLLLWVFYWKAMPLSGGSLFKKNTYIYVYINVHLCLLLPFHLYIQKRGRGFK